MSILKYEFYKLLCKKLLIFLILALFTVNIYLYISEQSNKDLPVPKLYDNLVKEYSSLPTKEALLKANQTSIEFSAISQIRTLRSQKISEQIIREQVSFMLQSGESTISYDDLIEKYKESEFMKESTNLDDYIYSIVLIKDQLQYLVSYPDFISTMDQKAEDMQSVSIFNKPGTFAYRNIIKTPDDFRKLKAIQLKLGDETGIVSSTQFEMTDIIIAVLIFLLCVYIFLNEKENGIIGLTKASKNGHTPVILSKLTTLTLISAGLAFVFYGINLVLGNYFYGFGDISRYVQSMSSFRDCSYLLTVKEFIILYTLTKTVNAMFISLVFALLFNLLSKAKFVFIGIGLFIGISYICYAFIHPVSFINVLKYLNIFNFFDVFGLYGNYININLFGYPISLLPATILVFIIVSVIAFLVTIFLYVKSYTGLSDIIGSIVAKLTFKRKKLHGNTHLFLHEIYKIFICNKVYLVILVALFIGYNSINVTPWLMNKEASDYRGYVDEMSGKVTPKKVQIIEEEQKRFDNISSEMLQLNESLKNGKINKKEYTFEQNRITAFAEKLNGFEKFKKQFQYLVNLKKEKNIDGSFICQLSSDYIFNNREGDLLKGLTYCILLILCLCSIFPMDYKNGMDKVLKCTLLGRLRLFTYKYIIGYIISLFLFIIVYLPYYINLLVKYDIKDWTAPIQSISIFSNINMDVNILGFVVIANLLQVLGCFAMASFILLISQLLKKQSFSIFISIILFAIPFVMSFMKIPAIDFFSLNNFFLLFTMLATTKFYGSIIAYLIAITISLILSVTFGGFKYCGIRTRLHHIIDKAVIAR